MKIHRIIRLADPGSSSDVIRVLSGFQLADGAAAGQQKWVTVCRTGTFTDPRYGSFEITRQMLLSMVTNFKNRVVGTDIFIDVSHKPADGAAAEIKELRVEGDRLRALAVFTEFGVDAVKKRGFRYLSAEYVENHVDNETGVASGPTLLGAGLTVRPVVKRLDPVQLSEPEDSVPTLIHPILLATLKTEGIESMDKWLKELAARLRARKLSEALITSLCEAAKVAAAAHVDDEKALKSLADQFDNAAEQMAVASPGNVTLSIQAPALDVNAEVVRILAERDQQAVKLAETAQANRDSFKKLLTEAKLSDEQIAGTAPILATITADSSPAQIKALADVAIVHAEQVRVNEQLRQLGFAGVAGTPRISMDESNQLKKLSATIKQNLMLANSAIKDVDEAKLSPFATKYLSLFDASNAASLHREARYLAGTTVDMSNVSLPVSFQRETILQALHDLKILDLVDARVDPSQSATHQIPYETRNPSNMVDDGLVFEGQGIPFAGVTQQMDLAYVNPVKLAMLISNESMFFTANSAINWDATARNTVSNARQIREMANAACANEMQRAADLYGAVAVSTETITSQVNGTRSTYKTAQFPIVRPLIERDLQGNQVGTTVAPIVVTLASTALSQYNGTGEQAAGNYYRIVDWNLGTFQIVNQAGAVQTPSNATALTIAYSYATNVVKVDSDLPSGVEKEVHYNKIWQAIGSRKAALSDDRYVNPNFLLMSNTLNDMVTTANAFTTQAGRADVSMNNLGDLTAVKGIPAWASNAPGIHLGDSRILVGERGTTKYTISKPYQMGAPFEAVNSAGKAIGKKMAYGEEFRSLKTPVALRERFTSVIVYSVTARAAI